MRARWAPRGSIRWLGVTFLAAFKDGKSPRYELEYGVPAAARPAVPAVVRRSGAGIEVVTGPLKFVVRGQAYDGIHAAWVDRDRGGRFEEAERVISTAGEAGPYVVDRSGAVYRASRDRRVEVAVEKEGPLHVVIRAAGWFEAADGRRLGKFTTYYEAFAGLPEILVNHAVVMTHDTRENQLRDVGFPLAVPGERLAFGLDDQSVSGPRTRRTFLVQERWDRARVGGGLSAAGQRSAGWVDAGRESLGVTLTAPYTPERFPKGFSADAGRMTYHLWPPDLGDTFTDAEELDRRHIYKLWFAHEGPALDLQVPRRYIDRLYEIDQTEKFIVPSEHSVQAAEASNGQGVALNESFLLSFRAGPLDPARAGERARLLETDPHAAPDPEWIARTGVFGPMIGVDREHYPDLERYMGRALLSLARLGIRENAEYGVWNFGDVHTHWQRDKQQAHLHRVWLSHHYGQPNVAWLLYAHYGDPALLDWARINNHHTMNVDIVHHEDPARPIPYHKAGAVYHCKGIAHWSGDAAFASHLATTSYLLWNWFMTGNLRARDVAREWQEGVLAQSSPGRQGRDGQTFLGEATEYYQNGWNPRMLELMDRFAREFLSKSPSEQHAAHWNPATFPRYHALTGSRLAFERLLDPRFRAEGESYHHTAYAYLVTGDAKRLEELDRDFYAQVHSQYDAPGSPYDGVAVNPGSNPWYWTMTQLQQLLVVQAAFKKAGRRIEPRRPGPPGAIYTRGYKAGNLTLATYKPAGQPIVFNLPADQETQDRLQVTGPDGRPAVPRVATVAGKAAITLPAEAPAGRYVARYREPSRLSFRPPLMKDAKEFYLLQRGWPHNLKGSHFVIEPLEQGRELTLTLSAESHPVTFFLLDPRGTQVARASVGFPEERKTLAVPPRGGPYTLVATRDGYLTPDADAAAVSPAGVAVSP
jgi:hypothetical protein